MVPIGPTSAPANIDMLVGTAKRLLADRERNRIALEGPLPSELRKCVLVQRCEDLVYRHVKTQRLSNLIRGIMTLREARTYIVNSSPGTLSLENWVSLTEMREW